jgi:hypothetical protein
MPRILQAKRKGGRITQGILEYRKFKRGQYRRSEIYVGFDDKIHPRSGLPIGEVAEINEYGDPGSGIPARPFLRMSLPEITRATQHIVSRAKLDGLFPHLSEKEIQEAANAAVDIVSDNILYFTTPGNAPSTIRRKGRDDPLSETNLLYNSVTTFIAQWKNR